MRLRARKRIGLAVLMLSACVGGCSGAGPFPVEGTVVWEDDTPAKELHLGSVVFDLPEKQTSARGVIQPDGTFTLTTNKPNDGALAGEYKVLVVEGGRKPMAGGDGSQLAPGYMDSRYADRSTTDLTATVKPGKNVIKLKVRRARRG
ncbi:MAG TPA: hypothetical protein VL371_19695 [Gemmataceae bacterium]|jgi:hypothetical protein|nr:hypothetical protein [Gemmataceae bacterium]